MGEVFAVIVTMQGTVEDISSFIEDILSSLTVVYIPIYDRYFTFFLLYEILRSYCHVIEKRKSVGLRFQATMMTWRSNHCKSIPFYSFQNDLNSIQSGLYCLKSCSICFLHIIRIFIDIQFTFLTHLIPHFLDKLVIILPMYLLDAFLNIFLTNLANYLTLDNFFQLTRTHMLQLLHNTRHSFRYLWMFPCSIMQQMQMIIYNEHFCLLSYLQHCFGRRFFLHFNFFFLIYTYIQFNSTMNESMYDPDDQSNIIKNLINDFKNVDTGLISQENAEKAIILLGETKAGKTTLLYYLLNKKLKRQFNTSFDIYQMSPQAKFFNAQIGGGYNSTTVYPNIPNQIGQDNVLLIDMPGFNDSRQYFRLLNIFIIRETIKKIKAVHICLVLPIESLSGDNFVEALTKKCFLLQHSFLSKSKCISFILTKVQDEESEKQIFTQNLQALSQEENKTQFRQTLQNFKKSNIYIFENAQPIQQKGAELKKKIIQQNNFYEINNIPSNLLSTNYGDVMMGNGKWHEFIDFISKTLLQLQQKLIKMLAILKMMMQIHYKQLLEDIKQLVEIDEQAFILELRSINLYQIQESKFIINRKSFKNKEVGLECFVDKFIPKGWNKGNNLLNQHMENAVSWAYGLIQQESNISSEVRTSTYHIFKYFHLIFSTIENINHEQIAQKYREISSSQEINEAFIDYLSLIQGNNVLQILVEHDEARNLINQKQQFRNKLKYLNPGLNIEENDQQSEFIKETIKIQSRTTIHNVQVKKILQNSTKVSSSKEKKKPQQKVQKLSIDSDIQFLKKKLKNMAPNKMNIQFLFQGIQQINQKIISKKINENSINILAKCYFEKTALFLCQLQMIQQAITFYLAIPSLNDAQLYIKQGINFHDLSEDFITQILIPFYSQISPNFQMIEQLYNYLNIRQINLDKIIKNEIKYTQTLKQMHDKFKTKAYKYKIKRFNYGMINYLFEENNKKKILRKIAENQHLFQESKLILVEEQLRKKLNMSLLP